MVNHGKPLRTVPTVPLTLRQGTPPAWSVAAHRGAAGGICRTCCWPNLSEHGSVDINYIYIYVYNKPQNDRKVIYHYTVVGFYFSIFLGVTIYIYTHVMCIYDVYIYLYIICMLHIHTYIYICHTLCNRNVKHLLRMLIFVSMYVTDVQVCLCVCIYMVPSYPVVVLILQCL